MAGKRNSNRLTNVNQNETTPPYMFSPGLSSITMNPQQQAESVSISGQQTLSVSQMNQQHQANSTSSLVPQTPSTSQFALSQMNHQAQQHSTLLTGSQFSNLQMFSPAPQFGVDQGNMYNFANVIPAFMSFMNTLGKNSNQFHFPDFEKYLTFI